MVEETQLQETKNLQESQELKINMQEIEKKWQKVWEDQHAFESSPSDKQKFYMVFAYPTVSGTLHVGHARSYTLPDVIARYKRMKGCEVFFPIGFHATGVDCLKILNECKEDLNKGSKKYGLEPEAADKFQTPLDVEKYLEKRMIAAFKRIGLSIDERPAVSTIDPHYNKFIQWQYRKLHEKKDYLIKGTYALPFCPKCNHVVSIDSAGADIAEGSEAEVKEFVVIKFYDSDGRIFPIATLRPETVFGVTNLWINPAENYVVAKVSTAQVAEETGSAPAGTEKEETWVISEAAVRKFQNLGKRVVVVYSAKGSDFDGLKIINPANEKIIPVIMAEFVDVEEATGVVMSVPAHDPFDYSYYKRATDAPDESIPLVVDIPIKGVPSAEILRKHGGDEEEALKELYKLEYRNKIRNDIPVIGGMPTILAKEKITEYLKGKGAVDKIYEFTEPVKCRCGGEVVIKQIANQWFVNYANIEWKAIAKDCISQMTMYPPSYKEELPSIIDWLHERPVARRQGLGTEFPFEKGWLIEALSDSTIYMAFYIVSKFYNLGKIKLEEIDDNLFDYVFLGKKEAMPEIKCSQELAIEIKKEFDYFYPLDVNFGGKEHKAVHFPFFIFHHSAIFPRDKWPKGIFVNWHLIREGEKLSKSKGNVIFWDDAIQSYGADALRLYMSHGSNQWTDFDWKDREMEMYKKHVESFLLFLGDMLEKTKTQKTQAAGQAGQLGKEEMDDVNKWMNAIFAKKVKSIEQALDNYEIRKAATTAFFEMRNDFQWYANRGGKNLSKEVLEDWLKILSIFMPHICEEYWGKFGNSSIISREAWPQARVVDEEILKKEEVLQKLIEDLNNIIKVVKEKKTKLYLYAVKDEEVSHLKGASEFMAKRFGFESISVFSVKDPNKFDPQAKAGKSKPGKPAIYLE